MYKKTSEHCKDCQPLGYSLLELMFAIALTGILVMLAVPSYQHIKVETNLFVLSNRIISALHFARNEAIKFREKVVVCKSTDAKHCQGDWRSGWIIYRGKFTQEPKKTNILQIYSSDSTTPYLEWQGAGGRSYVQFNAEGSAFGHNGSFKMSMNHLFNKPVWFIRLSQTGRIRIDKGV